MNKFKWKNRQEDNFRVLDKELQKINEEIECSLGIIKSCKALIDLTLRTDNIYEEETQRDIIEYQNQKNKALVLTKNLKRQKEFIFYKKRIELVSNDYQILSLYEELIKQKIHTKDASLFFTPEEKELLIDELKVKLKTIKIRDYFPNVSDTLTINYTPTLK